MRPLTLASLTQFDVLPAADIVRAHWRRQRHAASGSPDEKYLTQTQRQIRRGMFELRSAFACEA